MCEIFPTESSIRYIRSLKSSSVCVRERVTGEGVVDLSTWRLWATAIKDYSEINDSLEQCFLNGLSGEGAF